jgi:hypothetical protein
VNRNIIAPLFIFILIVNGYGKESPSSKSAVYDFPQYDLNIKVVPDSHQLEVEGTIQLPPTNRPREDIVLALSVQINDLKVEILKPATSAGIAQLKKTEPAGSRPGWGNNNWTVSFPHPAPEGEPILFRCSYTGGSEKTGFIFYLGAEGSFAGGIDTAWYPEVEEVSMAGNRLRGVGNLTFSVPPTYTVYCPGVERGSVDERRNGLFRFEINSPVYFSFGAARYTVMKSKEGTVPCALYMLHPRQNGEDYIKGALRVLDLLLKEFGTYPHPEFAIVEVPQQQASSAGFSGASVDGFIFASSDLLDSDFNIAFFGHEISHQWWGNIIQTNGTRGNYMIGGEAMAQYGALRVVEEMKGERAAEQFRRTGYPGSDPAQSGAGYFKLFAAGMDHALADLPSSVVSHELSDSKGFLVFDLLSRTIGRGKFRLILNNFTKDHAYQPVAWEEFLQALEKGAGTSLKWFFDQWFDRTGAPDWHLTWKQEGRTIKGSLTQAAPFYRATLDLRAEGENCQRHSASIEVSSERTEFSLPVTFQVQSVVIDPEFKVLHWTPEYHAEATALAAYTRANFKRIEGKSNEAQEEFREAVAHEAEPDLYGSAFMLRYGWARVFMNQKRWAEAREQLEIALASPVRRPETLPFVYLQLARVAKNLNDETTFRRAIESTITADAAAGGHTGAVELARALQASK